MSYHRPPNLTEFLQGDMVGNIRKGFRSKYFLNHECNCNSNTKVKGTCDYGGECRACFVVYKVTCIQCISFYVGITIKTLKKRLEKQFLDVSKIVHHNKNSYTFEAHLDQHFNKKLTPQ